VKLRLSSDFSIDTDQYKREGLRFSILAMSGHGKSNAAACIVEDVLEQHGQVIIIEPIPEWHCLTPETPVLLANGEVILADDLEERLFLSKGGKLPVVSHGPNGLMTADLTAVTREKTTELIQIKARMGRKLRGTPNHKVAIRRGRALAWVRLDEVQVGDRLLIPHRYPEPFRPRSYLRLQNLNGSRGIVIDGILYWSPRHGHKPQCKVPASLTPQLCEWLGYFLADGHLSKDLYKIMFIEGNEKRRLRFAELTKEIFNVEGTEAPDKWAYSISNKALGVFLKRVLQIQSGRKASSLRVPQVMMRAPNNLLVPFIKAYAECDGSGNTIATYSKWAAIQLCYLVERTGRHASLIETKVSKPHFASDKRRTHLIMAKQPTWSRVLLVKGSHLSYKRYHGNFDSVKIIDVERLQGDFEVIGTLVPKTHNLICGETPLLSHNTLKAKFNNVVVIGGPYQDLPLEPSFAHEYVQAALEKGISLVVNVSDIEDDAEQLRFVSSFLWNLYRLEQKYRRVLFLVLEESDIYAPQMWDQTSKQSLSRVSLIAKHGRKIGIFPILISQRPADLHKSPLSQCNINMFGKFTSPADLDPKTGLMFLVKKQHLPITEEQIMKLATGSFIISHKGGVDTVAVRKRLCPHGADTPLIEAKPFTADLSQALGNLREEISRALESKKQEQNEVKRLEKQVQELKKQNEQLQEKANIKLSVKEMMEGNGVTPQMPGTDRGEVLKLKEENAGLVEQLKRTDGAKARLEKELSAFGKLKVALEELFALHNTPEVRVATPNVATVGLQKVTKVVDVPEVKRPVGPFPTDTVKGKILALAKEGFLNSWKSVNEISIELIDKYRFNATEQAINGALKDLVDEHILGMKHTDRNRWSLAPDVIFEGQKEAS
jgi:hypothetical protein